MNLENNEVEISNKFIALRAALEALSGQIEHAQLPLWVQNKTGEFVSDYTALCMAITRLEPDFDKSAQETYSCYGAVAANAKLIEAMKAVNAAKDAFKRVCHHYQGLGMPSTIHQVLRRYGHGPISLKHAYRHLREVAVHPVSIAWTLTRNSSHRVISISEARQRLMKLGENQAIAIQLEQLSTLNPTEKLVIRREMKPYAAVNISARDAENNLLMEKIHTSLPVFFLMDPQKPLPEVRTTGARRSAKLPRADKKVEETPFLPSIAAYRYKA